MERIQNVNPNRLQWCCDQLGISLDQLALAARVPLENLQRVLAEQPGLTFAQLRRVAEYFGRGVLFFLEPEPISPEQVHTPQFRTLNNQKTQLSPKVRKLIENVERQREIYLALAEEVAAETVGQFSPPEIDPSRVAESAAIARRWLNLREQRTFSDYRNAVEAKGILVFRSNGYGGKWQVPKNEPICGFMLNYPTYPVIFVTKQVPEYRQTFTLMHELGHLLLHQSSSIDDFDDLYSHSGNERDANAFAGNILVPPKVIDSVDPRSRPAVVTQFDDWMKPLRKQLGVSTEVLLRRLLDSGKLDQRSYVAYREWKSSLDQPSEDSGNRVYRHREPVHLFGDRFVRTVLESLYANKVTLARASRYLDNLKIADVHKLEQWYAHP